MVKELKFPQKKKKQGTKTNPDRRRRWYIKQKKKIVYGEISEV